MVTIKDVAREAGVSVSTVSFAINGTAPVAPDTKKRILEVVERLGFQPSSAARGLVTRRSNTIGLYVPNPGEDIFNFAGNIVFSNMLQGIGEIAEDKGSNLLLSWDHKDREKASKALDLARGRTVDGLLFMNPNLDASVIRELIELKFPFVIMGHHFKEYPVNTVDIDNFSAAYDNTTHLIRLGHKRIAFISPGPLDFYVSEDRYEGYLEALKDANLPAIPEYFYVGNHRVSSGSDAMRHFLACKEPPTAVVAGRDNQALGVLEYAKVHGLNIPEDMALVSFENSDLAEKYNISSVVTDLYLIGREAAKVLFQLIGRGKERLPKNLVIPSKLVIRSSCGGHNAVEQLHF